MSNLSQKKREEMLSYLNQLKEIHTDDESRIALEKIETALTEKKYGLVWEEHEEEVDKQLVHNIPVFREVEERKIVSDEIEGFNFLLEGDNLHSLKLLEKTHRGKIDVIYIDPPYNTGNKDFIYDDNYVGTDDGYRHSKWLSFMNERLVIAKDLLSEEGIIFISIDDNEQAQLKLLCDQTFGENNFINKLTIKTGDVYGSKAAHIDKTFVKTKDYVLIYRKSEENKKIKKVPLYDSLSDLYDTHYTHIIDDGVRYPIMDYLKENIDVSNEFKKHGLYLNKKNINKLLSLSDSFKKLFLKKIAPKLYKDSQFNQKLPDEIKNEVIRKGILNYNNKLLMSTSGDKIRHLQAFTDVLRFSDDSESIYWRTIPRGDCWTDFAKDMGNVGKEGKVLFSNGKKPLRLILQLLKWANTKSSIVLDFFAGSGTTGHAVMKLNKEDGGNRKYILCTNNENNICEEITYQRLKNIQEDLPHNLKYYKTDFIPKLSEEEDILSSKLLDYIKEMVELENMCEIDGKSRRIILSDEELQLAVKEMKEEGFLYIPSFILLTNDVKSRLDDKNIEVIPIPDYYFMEELREVNEL
ncbi:site-specific DNA-methyltransferase [Miniphocaeibacter halophilus]|uniref:Site-specific DNA-methyltransferase n=1 Tax=Miniphocaeibacter halophilus TaxID=2931922 RepID=A0AC61MX06_9FIRM|nr:site-specific DNA-methyltransferase [Miniphocaeibacter halophilus]QQK08834.1 site-specific DNA-methyltransferase [Miniphocaeibacter halophilus]